jgi:uncharacterized protein YprB with RNaseH-like and TPR domain
MTDKCNTGNILFLDIETVPQFPSYRQLPPVFSSLWDKKSHQLGRFEKVRSQEAPDPEGLYERAGIYAEFGKIICISTAVCRNKTICVKSCYEDDERDLLSGFASLLGKLRDSNITHLCAHNGKEFDYPYIIRRMLINGIVVPEILDLSGKKPWEVRHLDTMELWKFGDAKSYTSLELLAAVFGIPTPKDDIGGSDVARVYWQDHVLPRIVQYCQKDVIAIVNLLLRFRGEQMIVEDRIHVID